MYMYLLYIMYMYNVACLCPCSVLYVYFLVSCIMRYDTCIHVHIYIRTYVCVRAYIPVLSFSIGGIDIFPNSFPFSRSQTTLGGIQEETVEALGNKNPSVKAETLLFVTRCVQQCSPAMLPKAMLKAFVPVIVAVCSRLCMYMHVLIIVFHAISRLHISHMYMHVHVERVPKN